MSQFRTLPYEELAGLLEWRHQQMNPQVEERPQQGRFADSVDMFQMGGYQALAGLADFFNASGAAQWLYDRADMQMDQLSDRGFEAMNKPFVERDEEGNYSLGAGVTDFDTWLLGVANLAGQFLPTAIPGAGASGLLARGAAAARGGRELGRGARAVSDGAAMGFTGGAAATGQAMQQARAEFDMIDDEVLAESPMFRDYVSRIRETHPEFNPDEVWEAARDAIREQLSDDVRKDPVQLLGNFGLSAIGDPILMRALAGRGLSRLSGLRGIAATGATGAITEGLQEGTMQFGVQRQVAQVDDRDPMEGVVLAGLNAAPIGGGFGTAVGVAGATNRRIRGIREPLETGSPEIDNAARGLSDTLNEGLNNLDLTAEQARQQAAIEADREATQQAQQANVTQIPLGSTGSAETGATTVINGRRVEAPGTTRPQQNEVSYERSVALELNRFRLSEPVEVAEGNRWGIEPGVYEFVSPNGVPLSRRDAVQRARDEVNSREQGEAPAFQRSEDVDLVRAQDTADLRDEFGRQVQDDNPRPRAPERRNTRSRIPEGDEPAVARQRGLNTADAQLDVEVDDLRKQVNQSWDQRTREGELLDPERPDITPNTPVVDERDPNWSRAERDAVDGASMDITPEDTGNRLPFREQPEQGDSVIIARDRRNEQAMRERLENEPLGIEDKGIIFAGDESGSRRRYLNDTRDELPTERTPLPDAVDASAAETPTTETPEPLNFRKNGQPFKTRKSAESSAGYREAAQQGAVEAVEVEGGWAWRAVQADRATEDPAPVVETTPVEDGQPVTNVGVTGQRIDAMINSIEIDPMIETEQRTRLEDWLLEAQEALASGDAETAQRQFDRARRYYTRVSNEAVDADGGDGGGGAPNPRSATQINIDDTSVQAEFRVVEASALQTSHDFDGMANEAYPSEMQNRARDDAKYRTQVEGLANNPRPVDLTEGTTARGTPITRDGVVESGNGRTIGLREAYRRGNAEAYRQYLLDNAERYGLTREQIESMEAPILVRERTQEMTPEERRAFVRKANTDDQAALSVVEQATSDAALLTDEQLSQLMDSDLTSARNRAFLDGFIRSVLSRQEQNNARSSDGAVTRQTMDRIQAAVIAKAYGEGEVLTNAIQRQDQENRNLTRALVDNALLATRAQESTVDDLMSAVRYVSESIETGRSIQELTSQGDMLTGDAGAPQRVAALATALRGDNRSARKLAGHIQSFLSSDGANFTTVPNQPSMFDDDSPRPTGNDLLVETRGQAEARRRREQQAETPAINPLNSTLEDFVDSSISMRPGAERTEIDSDPMVRSSVEASLRREWIKAVRDADPSTPLPTKVLDSFYNEFGMEEFNSVFRGAREGLVPSYYDFPQFRLWDKTYDQVRKGMRDGTLSHSGGRTNIKQMHREAVLRAARENAPIPENVYRQYEAEIDAQDLAGETQQPSAEASSPSQDGLPPGAEQLNDYRRSNLRRLLEDPDAAIGSTTQTLPDYGASEVNIADARRLAREIALNNPDSVEAQQLAADVALLTAQARGEIAKANKREGTLPEQRRQSAETASTLYSAIADGINGWLARQGGKPVLESRLSKTPDTRGMSKPELQRFADRWSRDHGTDVGVTIETYANPAELEAAVGESYGFDSRTRAAYNSETATVYLFSDNIANAREARETLRHEILAHHGIRNAMNRGQALDLINRILATRDSSNRAMQEAWATVERRYPDAPDTVKAEEVFALVAEGEGTRLGDAWSRVVATITRFLRSIGLLDANQVNQSELRAILQDIATNFKEGRSREINTRSDRQIASDGRSTEAGDVQQRGSVPRGVDSVAASQDAAGGREADGSLRGLPRRIRTSNGEIIEASHYAPAAEAARLYSERSGIPYNPPQVYVKADPERGARIAEAYEQMLDDPQNPEVREAYQAMIRETLDQYRAMVDATGIEIEFYPRNREGKVVDPYPNGPREATQDAVENNHLYVYPTADGYGSGENAFFSESDVLRNPMLQDSGIEFGGIPATVNDVFRAVHDFYGHVKEGVGFRADGEENAWQSHAAMYSPLARRAMTTETRGQNSWLNFGPYGESNRTAKVEDTIFAEQKIGLLPEWVGDDGRMGGADRDGLGNAALLQSRIDEARDMARMGFRHEKAKGGLTQSELDAIRETGNRGYGAFKKLMGRLFRPGGNLPNSAFEAAQQRDADVKVHAFDLRGRVNALTAAVKESYGKDYDNLTVAERTVLNGYLTTSLEQKARYAEDNGLSKSVVEALDTMRQHVDSLSREYMGSLQTKKQNFENLVMDRMVKDGIPLTEENMAEQFANDSRLQAIENLLNVFDNNLGRYLHRSYRAFDDPKWFRKVPQKTIEEAVEFLTNERLGRDTDAEAEEGMGITPEQARDEAIQSVQDILKGSTAYNSLYAFIAEGRFGARDTRHLKARNRRLVESPEIRALLGEYTDPTTNYSKTVAKTATLIANESFLNTLLAEGLNTFLFTKEARDPQGLAVIQIAGTKNEAYAPLNGLYVTKEFNTALQDLLGDPRQEGWANAIVQANAWIKYGKTVLSPTTAMRNVMSSSLSIMNAGHFMGPRGRWKKSWATFKDQVLNQSDEKTDAYFRELIKLGVLNDSVTLGEMRIWIRDANIDELVGSNSTNPVRRKLSDLNQMAQGFYRFGDDFWKVAGFESEKQMLLDAGLSEADANKRAAETIRDLYPTYSKVGALGRWLSRFPLVGTFVSFPAEIIRTTYNTLDRIHSDLQSDNPKIRAMGHRRILGMMMAHSATFALAAITKAALGISDEEEQAVREMSAPWAQNSTFLWAGRDEDGNLRYFDMTFIDLYGQWKRPIEAMMRGMRGKPWNEVAASAAWDTLAPFLGVDITAGTIFQALSNRKESGGQIYKPNDPPIRQTVDIARFLGGNLAPGFVGNATRLTYAATERKRSLGQPYDMGDELLALLGFRSTTFDPGVSLYYRTFQFNQELAEARTTLSELIRDPNNIRDGAIESARERAQRKQDRAFRDMSNLVRLAQETGLSRNEVIQMLRLQNVSQENVAALLAGRSPRVDMSPQSIRRAMRQAQIVEGDEGLRRVRERALKSRGLAE